MNTCELSFVVRLDISALKFQQMLSLITPITKSLFT